MTDVVNDATDYGVRIVPAEVETGQTYWRAVRVHHLLPEENNGRHHILLDAVDEAGERMYGVEFTIFWDGGSEKVIIQDPPPAAGASFPMWKWQVCSVAGVGLPSDLVINLRTDHPDEGDGNTLFHHSFAITFIQAVASAPRHPTASVISGRVPGGGGHALALWDAKRQVQLAQVASNERYQFENLPAGVYLIYDKNDLRVAGPVTVDGVIQVELDFAERPPAERWTTRYFLFGDPDLPETGLYLSLLADHLVRQGVAWGFDVAEAAQAAQVTVVGSHAPETLTALDEAGCELTVLPLEPRALLAALLD